jgi:hypothetical protein
MQPRKPPKSTKPKPAAPSREEKELRKWQAEKAEAYRKQARANMQRAKEHAQKAERRAKK